ncbi:MAG TPA: butyryl-CoA:acetate CoA-transferase, partial [Bacillota bacterium]|nr:butyryl-CoA:acetate CoA-transferase [Bacillota bacterium]
MDFQELYKQKLVTPAEAVKVIKSGDWVEYGSFSGGVIALDKALAARKDELTDVKVRACTRAAPLEIIKADPAAEHFTYNNWHFSGLDRKLHDQGSCWYMPVFYHEVPKYYREVIDTDVAMLVGTPMDEHGYINFGPQNSHTKAICDKAKVVIMEINPNVPRCLGGR